ncbi:MAG TPA: DUF167 domain-containing protein [Acidimicrobiales bacterium]|nr:DUF167 domain-containing protein [Acidimicrobiales bacterium]
MVGKGDVDDLFDVVAGPNPDDENVEILLRVRVQPGAGRTAVIGRYGHGPGVAALKLKVAAPPEGGRANSAVTELLATTLGLAKDAVRLVSGATSRSKRFQIGPIELDVARRLLVGAGGAAGAGGPAGGGANAWAGPGNARGRRGVR